ncbi:MAG: pectate lyase [Prevotella sp.]
MKKILTMLILQAAVSLSALAQFQSAPAFPGAEGHGRFVTGGREGEIRYVTNLNDSGTGSFREAVNGDAKKIVVFNVGGVIALSSDINIGANTTILGQTAPGQGITLRYYTVNPGANNIIRFIRFRRGQERDVNDGADASTQRQKTGIILDHCSFSWSIDEVASFYDNNNFTMQWCTIAESLTNAGHDKGAHGYGGIWGGKLASFHHNMIAHVTNRGPRFNGARYGWTGYTANKDFSEYNWENPAQAENVDFRNCVMYNAQGTCYGGPGCGQINMVNNFYKAGPCGNGNQERITIVTVSSSGNSDENHPEYYGMTSRYYISGNTTLTTAGVKTANKDWAGVTYDSGVLTQNGLVYSKDANSMYPADVPSITSENVRYVLIKMDEPAPTGYITTHTADKAFEKVLAYVGASYNRDDVDARYVNEATNGTATYKGSVTGKPGLIDVVSDVNGYTEETFGTASYPEDYDSDGDGMPDEWEMKWGLNPNNAADAKKYTMDPNGYYTNIEMYANSLVEDIMKGGCLDGDANYTEYWPELKVVEPTPGGEGEEVSMYLAQSTNVSTNTTNSSYAFNSGDYDVTITNTRNKTYAVGEEDGIKYSRDIQYTINLPSDIVIKEVVFTGYDNYADADAYLSELNGQEFLAIDYVFPMKDGNVYQLTTQKVQTEAIGSFTFTPSGQQVVWTITLNGAKTTGVYGVMADKVQTNTALYNIAGQKVNSNYKGLVIKDGKKFVNVAQ